MLSLFLTIIVGFLGTIMGLFFSNEALNELRKKYDYRSERLVKIKDSLKRLRKSLIKGK